MAEGRSNGVAIIIAVPAIVVVSLFAVILLFMTGGSAAASCLGTAGTADPDDVPTDAVAGYSGEQLSNAAYIMNAATALDLERDAQIIGVMAAMGESSLRIIDYGDTAGPDSRGLFQQRDNGAWGTYEDRMDPTISATNFFTALQRVPGWQTLEPTIAIHKVQRNSDPFHYEKYFDAADQVVSALAGDGTGGGCASGSIVPPLSPGYNMTSGYGPRTINIPGASRWHPAIDLQHWPNPCGDQIYSISDGTVTYVGGIQLTVKSPDGWSASYLHMKLTDIAVDVGDSITAGQPIALVGDEGPSGGCHLDLRINKEGTTDAAIAALPAGEDLGGPPTSYGFVDPVQLFNAFGIDICPPESCRRQ
ncbi:M23 family metallopeptidase [Micromonospora sp. DT81.3]|uniref:M23 family metallopeptidase n=1 Tax=Micromonospora sp. DT81.3 TaxID=3416523 RepID=UPI003CF38017